MIFRVDSSRTHQKLKTARVNRYGGLALQAPNPRWGLLSLIFFIVTPTATHAQTTLVDGVVVSDTKWYEGSILLKTGSELRGLVRYNDKTGILQYENGSNTGSYLPRTVEGFEFLDEETGRQRVFYSLPYQEAENTLSRPYFFEVLLELKDFAILSRVSSLDVDTKTKHHFYDPAYPTSSGLLGTTKKTSYSQSEIIFFMRPTGEIIPYLELTETEIDKPLFDRSVSKSKVLNKDVLEEIVGPVYENLRAYAKEHDLKFTDRDNLIEIFKYYAKENGNGN